MTFSSTDVLTQPLAEGGESRRTAWWATVGRHLLLISQLMLALAVVYLYKVENPTFLRLFGLATAGFVVNLLLPISLRLPFFALLSFTGVFVVFGAVDGAWLIAAGLTLIGLARLPVRFGWRIAIVSVVGLLLALSRGGLVSAPWSGAVWPILGSMFMFRLALYMLATKNGPDRTKSATAERGPWATLSYFFMLPNLVFPLFPVVDYQTFKRTHYDKPEFGIYEQGMLWISRGLVHLLLYRLVYHSLLNDPVDVVALGDLVQFMLGTFLLYLRVSGQFHLIVGMLHLFGFRLPETHRLYYLAHSYTDLWRRINIYWTDFMMKTVFYPTYFKVKQRGPVTALVLSTTAVFVTTWILHSYQWFWLRGGFPITAQDTLFWGILGGLVVYGAVRELKTVKKAKPKSAGWNWRLGLKSVVTFTSFCFLWSLWSTESVTQWVWMLGAAFSVDVKGIILLVGTLALVWYFGGRGGEAVRATRPPWQEVLLSPTVRSVTALVVLLALAHPSVKANAEGRVEEGLRAMSTTGLNARDAALQHRGYYEQLEVRGPLAGQVADAVRRQGEHWDDLASVGMLRQRRDMLQRDLVPSKSVDWNGNRFSTNRWGMRDRDYTLEKPAGTLRVALLGPSHVMGNGVPDGATFEALVEARVNAEVRLGAYEKVEILNFGVDGYSLLQQIAMLEDRVFAFSPDIVIATHYQRNRQMTERYMQKIAWDNVAIPYEPVAALFRRAGLADMDRGTTPVPFGAGRHLAKSMGLEPRMPASEAAARARRIADDILDWSLGYFAESTRRHGAKPMVLALNAVIDDVPPQVPNLEAIRKANLPVLDLFDVFPEAERPQLRVAPWDDHPNVVGHRLIAARLFAGIVPQLEAAARLRP